METKFPPDFSGRRNTPNSPPTMTNNAALHRRPRKKKLRKKVGGDEINPK
jgi:hypothetical protein